MGVHGTPKIALRNPLTNEDITGLYEGDYIVTVTDARGCTFVSPANPKFFK